jgi:hypothetical protein
MVDKSVDVIHHGRHFYLFVPFRHDSNGNTFQRVRLVVVFQGEGGLDESFGIL